MGSTGCVVGIDHIKELVDLSKRNVEKDAPDFLAQERIKLLGELCQIVLLGIFRVSCFPVSLCSGGWSPRLP